MTIRLRYFFSILILCFAALDGTGQQAKPAHTIRLRAGNITPAAKAGGWTTDVNDLELPAQVMIHFDMLPDAAAREALAQSGITLLDYIPDNTFTAIVRKQLNKAGVAAVPVNSIVTMRPEWKADEYLWRKAKTNTGNIKVIVSLYAGVSSSELMDMVAALKGKVVQGGMADYGSYTVLLGADKLRDLAGWYGVRFISPYMEPVTTDRQAVPTVRGGRSIGTAQWNGYGLNGDSVTVGVGDNTSGVFHSDLVDRITNYNPAAVTNHGIHINGIVGGAAIIDPLAQSMAPKVKLVDFFFSTVLTATGSMLQEHNMTITNNSYTVMEGDCDYFGTYDLYSVFLDSLALRYPSVQHVFAAGNDGNLNCSPYPNGYATMGGGYQPSKNTVVVGSITHNLKQAENQSRGPVRDGRIRPDVVAVGADVYSCLRDDTYKWAGGTSMASPQVASGLAVMTQQYKRLHGTQPRADLLKTVLIATATDMGTPGPDFSYGFGLMDVARALGMLDSEHYASGNIGTGDSQNIVITVPAGIAQAKVTLYWNDIPANPAAATQLVNDLDMTVRKPDGGLARPMVPDAAIANVLKVATEREDHLNNTEQVIINTPVAGTYTVTVKGHAVPYGPQHFVVAYDLLPKQLELTFPTGGEQLSNVDSIRVFWSAVSDDNTFKVEFSFDGTNWSVIKDNLSADTRYCGFMPTGFNSGNCRVRVSRNGTSEVMSSQRFAISDIPQVAVAASQCPGYMAIHWKPVPFATEYEVLKKVGAQMVVVDTVADTAYVFRNMSLTEESIVAVQPIINGIPGYRSLAVKRLANDGNCAMASSIGDLMVEKVLSPQSGRLLTSTAPGATSNLTVQVRNLYNVMCGSYTCAYSINGAAWQELSNPAGILPESGSAVVSIPGLSFSMPGDYNIAFAIHNNAVADPQPENDTLLYTLRVLPNEPVDLSTAFADGFEDMDSVSIRHNALGISPNGHWDFYNNDDSGRLRSYVYDKVLINGNRSVSLDQFMPMSGAGSENMLRGTFNLSAYDTAADEVRVDFDYVLHSIPRARSGNVVRARGVDAVAWTDLFQYDFNAYPGELRKARSVSLTDAVRKGNFNFSASTQLAFCQNDTTVIADRDYGSGITFDNFRLYTVTNDALLAGIVSPQPNNCGLPGSLPLRVRVRNGVNHTLYNVALAYKLNGGAVYTGVIDSIKGKDSLDYTFAQQMDIAGMAGHHVDVWLNAPGDSYQQNDSLLNYQFLNSRIITDYPYLEDFEAGDGGFYASGYLSSWEYGTPSADRIGKAASGSGAWKTNLTGRYNSLEKSYLYTPCYDISELEHPTLSFSMAQDLENCGNVLCDGAYLEYSFDGTNWIQLGSAGQGTNWYETPFDIWNTLSYTRWHVATIPLPKPTGAEVLHLRFVLFADPAVTFEGLAIDDVHMYDLKYGISPSNGGVSVIDGNPASGVWTNYMNAGGLVAALQPQQSIGNTTVTLYEHDTLYNPGMTQYVLPRSYTISSETGPADSVITQIYVNDSDFERIVNDTSCISCAYIPDVYSLGVTQYYNNSNHKAENGTLKDDTGGTYIFHPSAKVKWVPYDKGYRAELAIKPFSELWLNSGGPTANFPAGMDYLNFLAFRNENRNPLIYWHSLIDTSTNTYILQRSVDGREFEDILQQMPTHTNPGAYKYIDTSIASVTAIQYYRLRWTMSGNDRVYYSPVRRVDLYDTLKGLVEFDAAMVSSDRVVCNWTSWIDGLATAYELERAIGDGSYTMIDKRTATRVYGQSYAYTDMPMNIAAGTRIHYRLKAILFDGSVVELPVRTVEWIDKAIVNGVYPNPTHDGQLTISWTAEAGTAMELSIMDITGRQVETFASTAGQWNNVTQLQTAEKAKGVYIVRIVIGGYRYNTRVVYD